MGLGVGTIAAWGRAGDEIVFYELNPSMLDLRVATSRSWMILPHGHGSLSEMRDCRSSGKWLTRESRNLRPDCGRCFLRRCCPVHLLTRECFGLYLRALAPSGVLAIHIRIVTWTSARLCGGSRRRPAFRQLK